MLALLLEPLGALGVGVVIQAGDLSAELRRQLVAADLLPDQAFGGILQELGMDGLGLVHTGPVLVYQPVQLGNKVGCHGITSCRTG